MYAVNVGDENYYKQYKVAVQAVNKKGEGPISEEIIIFSAESSKYYEVNCHQRCA